jgi:hypothetical protein
MDLIWVKLEGQYFWQEVWTGQISLIGLANFRLWRNAFARRSFRENCPAGKSVCRVRSILTPSAGYLVAAFHQLHRRSQYLIPGAAAIRPADCRCQTGAS